jgi:PhzF family phenazine biosynthesis protein
MTLRYRQVDVFSAVPFAGNGLAVFPDRGGLTASQMLHVTQELRQFESIFLAPTGDPARVSARIFTMDEELPFAGHPILGAAAVLHLERSNGAVEARWLFDLPNRTIAVETRRNGDSFNARMDQGEATFSSPLSREAGKPFADALSLGPDQLHPELPLQVVSTGLPYLIVPVQADLGAARIGRPDFETLLAKVGAKFVYVLDPAKPEGRTWDNQGGVEDVATGSAAGPAAAYLVRHGRARAGDQIAISQGARAGRPSQLRATVLENGGRLTVVVEGDVVPIGSGVLDRLPGLGG